MIRNSSNPHSPTGIAPVLQVHPSRRCNIACAHCYTSSGPGIQEEIRLDLLLGCLQDAVTLGYRQLALSGGEPLLYRSLAELLSYARNVGMLTTITTNGMLATSDCWEPLAPFIDVAAISIDGTPAEHDTIRRCKGAFDCTVNNLEVIRASGVPFGFIFTLTQHNVNSLEFVVRLAAQQGARSVQVHPLTLTGRAAKTLQGVQPDELELVAALFEASRLGRDMGVAVHVDALTLEQLIQYRDHIVPERIVKQLVDVAPVLIVGADATITPLTHEICPTLQLGSLWDARLSTLSQDWLAVGRGDRLAEACGRTWTELTEGQRRSAVYWYDEVAVRTREQAVIAACP